MCGLQALPEIRNIALAGNIQEVSMAMYRNASYCTRLLRLREGDGATLNLTHQNVNR